MRTIIIGGTCAAFALAACGGAINASENATGASSTGPMTKPTNPIADNRLWNLNTDTAAMAIDGPTNRANARPVTPGNVVSLSQWLLGHWIAKGGYCASGDPLVFEPGGDYRTSGGDVTGRWSLTGSTLTLNVVESDIDTGEDVPNTRQRYTLKLTRLGANDMMYGKDRLKRCPKGDGIEPWHPSVKFDTE